MLSNLKLRLILCFVFVVFLVGTTNAQELNYGRGCILSDLDTSLVSKAEFPVLRGQLPYSYSLKSYAPAVGSQGALGSCTSWACGYAAFTIVKRIEKSTYSVGPFSPLNLYNRVKTSRGDSPCSDGSSIDESLNVLRSSGCELYSNYNKNCDYEYQRSYTNKLSDYGQLSLTEYSIKQALNNNCPVVISIDSYKDYSGWENSKNLVNGIWNGAFSTQEEGAHAMCIVGYDDQRGAFEVMNSWGSDWGNGGFFWLRYKDLYHLNAAFCLKPSSGGNGGDISSAGIYGDYFRMVNNCSKKAYVALCQYVGSSWVTKGWYGVEPNSSIDLPIDQRQVNKFYWMASNAEHKIYWTNSAGVEICVDPTNAFEIYDQSPCPEVKGFYEIIPEVGCTTFVQSITCPNYTSRGSGESEILAGTFSGKLDSGDPLVSNMYWEPYFLLKDALTGQLIFPNQEGKYEVWLSDGSSNEEFISCSGEELKKISKYKFVSKINAENFKKAIK
jgi:C1A family cysteine protease